jgi:hypothetical protein
MFLGGELRVGETLLMPVASQEETYFWPPPASDLLLKSSPFLHFGSSLIEVDVAKLMTMYQ